MSSQQPIDFALDQSVSLAAATVQLHPTDQVVIARASLQAGTMLTMPDGSITARQTIPGGHKIALAPIARGEAVRRYGQFIGVATRDIQPGDHVHSHNLSLGDFTRDYAFSTEVQPVEFVPADQRRTFMGYRRSNGRVGTRNFIAIISTVNCSAHVTRQIANAFTPDRLAAYPNVDGVIALTHPYGCSAGSGSADQILLQRILGGMARHTNVGAYVLVGLGCEVNQISELIANQHLNGDQTPIALTIQDLGGTRRAIEAGIQAVETLLPRVNAIQRTPQPVSELMIGLECGGSDGWSGVTANPLVGLVADELVRQGGSIVLAETTEIYGAEHLLTRRAIDRATGEKLIARISWWEDFARQHHTEIDNNPTPGNKAGGLTTIFEKSLGAIAKAGHTPLTGVYEYAEPITTRGFAFMDSPGNDPVSVTGEVASGCNVVLFTTGRGSVFGFKPAPSIKIATNSAMFNRLIDDMDFNAGRILDGESIETLARELLDLTIAVASGQPSKSEAQNIGEAEFCPWHLGETL